MSRIGKKPVVIPANVTVEVAAGNVVTAKGPKGTLTHALHPDMILKVEGNVLTVERPDEEHLHKSLHGLTRTLLSNMVEGVEKGYSKELEVKGVGYRAEKKGNQGVIHITLKYLAKTQSVLCGLRRVSKPGLRGYAGADELPKGLKGLGIAIVSTSKGVMTDKAARAAHVGGEVLAFVW